MAKKMVKLGDVATYINGYAFKPEDRGKIGLPIIRIQDLTGNSYDLGFYDGMYPQKIEINNGDILISWSASLGVYIWNRGKALLNQHIFKVEFDSNYYFNSCWKGKIVITETGDVLPCVFGRNHICGNIREQSIKSIITQKGNNSLRKLWEKSLRTIEIDSSEGIG